MSGPPDHGHDDDVLGLDTEGLVCTRCGYDLTALAPGGVCAECGAPALVLVHVAATWFEAQAVLAVLANDGIHAVAAHEGSAALRAAAGGRWEDVPILVGSGECDRARDAIAASTEIDWDGVDVGDRADGVPLRRAGRMPAAARVGWVVGVALLILSAIAVVVMILL